MVEPGKAYFRLLVTWSTRTYPLILCFALLLASACSDSGDENAVAVTVFIPSGGAVAPDGSPLRLVWSVEYKVNCGASVDDSLALEGTLEQVDGVFLERDGLTAVYKGMVEFEPGPCAIQLLARDTDGEVVCSYTGPMTFDSELPSEAYFDMICFEPCPTISFPGTDTVAKTSCAAVGGLILSAETLVGGVQHVRYAITQTSFLDNNSEFLDVYEGELALGFPGTVDLGDGPVPTQTWEATVGVLAPDVRYGVELTALDIDGTPRCSAETSFEVLFGGIAQVHVVLPCSGLDI